MSQFVNIFFEINLKINVNLFYKNRTNVLTNLHELLYNKAIILLGVNIENEKTALGIVNNVAQRITDCLR